VTDTNLETPSPEAIKLAIEQAKSVLKKLPLLGPIAWLCMNSPQHRNQFIADLEWRVMPALVLDQAKLYMRDEAPVAYASWAFLSPEAAERYRATGRLAPGDWKSGSEAWLIDLVAPFGGGGDVINDVKEKVLAGREVRVRGEAGGETI
jgi:cytolysin-activating lysine-acyltransferase